MVPVSSAESMRGATWTRRGCLVWWSEHRVRIVDADSGAVVGEWSHGDVVAGCRALRDDRVASFGYDGIIQIAGPDGAVVALPALPEPVFAVEPWRCGLVAADLHGVLYGWQPGENPTRLDIIVDDQLWRGTAFAVDGDRLTAFASNDLLVYDLASPASETRLHGHTAVVNGVRLLPGDRALSWSDDATLRVWNIGAGTSTALRGHTLYVSGAVVYPHGIVSWSGDGTIRFWTDAGEARPGLGWNIARPALVETIGDETLVAVTGDRCLHVFDAGRGVATVMEAHRDTVLGIVASPDRSRLLSWSADRTARLWSADELRPT